MGETPIKYLIGWRMTKARHLRKYTETTIDDIATAIGYPSESSFNRATKKMEPDYPWAISEVG